MKRITQLLIAFLLLTSCEQKKTTEEQSSSSEKSVNTSSETLSTTTAVPVRTYKIISEKENVNPKSGFNKCNIEVELKEKITKEELTVIANQIRETRKSYDKLWIFYKINGSEVWATTHFTPNLEVEIIGTTSSTDEKLNSEKVDGQTIGKWRDNRVGANWLIVIYKKNNKLFSKTICDNGNTAEDEFVKKKFNGKVRFEPKENRHKEYYLVEKNGNLGMYDGEGKYGEALKTN